MFRIHESRQIDSVNKPCYDKFENKEIARVKKIPNPDKISNLSL